jgi:hypothetical protein
MLSALKKFFAAVDGSIKGLIVPEELYRAILTSLSSGSSAGVVILLIQAVATHASTIFPNATVASLATALLTLILDLLRRQGQGTVPAPVISPQLPPVSAPASA